VQLFWPPWSSEERQLVAVCVRVRACALLIARVSLVDTAWFLPITAAASLRSSGWGRYPREVRDHQLHHRLLLPLAAADWVTCLPQSQPLPRPQQHPQPPARGAQYPGPVVGPRPSPRHNFVPFVETPQPASTTVCGLARVARASSRGPFRRAPSTCVLRTKRAPWTRDGATVASFAASRSASPWAWSRKWCGPTRSRAVGEGYPRNPSRLKNLLPAPRSLSSQPWCGPTWTQPLISPILTTLRSASSLSRITADGLIYIVLAIIYLIWNPCNISDISYVNLHNLCYRYKD